MVDARMTADAHEVEVARLREAYAALPPGRRCGWPSARPTCSGSAMLTRRPQRPRRARAPWRGKTAQARRGLDVSAFGHALCVDPDTRTARVGGMTTYEDLCDATLRHQLMPLVVPQLKTITLGGAVTGLGIESTALRSGMPHESVTEMEILTGDGRVIRATDDNEHADLFRGFPNSYGTLGYSLSLTIELEPVQPFVHIRHFPFGTAEACMHAISQIAAQGSFHGHRADFVDGTALGPDELYLTVGAFSDVAPWRSDYTGQQIYYESIRRDKEDFLTIRDYLWRWDTDWFWCSRPFGVQKPLVRKMWPRRYRPSDVYRKLVALDHRYGLFDLVNARRHLPPRERVIQDVDPSRTWCRIPAIFPGKCGNESGMDVPAETARRADLASYPLRPGEVYVNFGFWGTVPLPGVRPTATTIVSSKTRLRGWTGTSRCIPRRSTPRTSSTGNTTARRTGVKRAYDGDGRLLGLYEKCVKGR